MNPTGRSVDGSRASSVPLSAPDLCDLDAEAVRRCVADGWVSTAGPHLTAFEDAFAAAVGARSAVAVASGTAALHLALLVAGVGRGDEVWVSDLTFVASANGARYCGADVVLVDSERVTWNLDTAVLCEELDRRARHGRRQPKAVVAVHLLGHPAPLGMLAEACRRHGVTLIEDAAEALGGGWTPPADGSSPVTAGRPCRSVGTIGELGCFSFNGNKMLTTGGGGMVVTDDPELAGRVRHLATQAKLPGLAYDHDLVGFNYRMPALNAALGLGQLARLDRTVEARRAVADRYDAAFSGRAGLTTQPDEAWAYRCGWLSAVLFEDRDRRDLALARLREAGIEARPLWTPLHHLAPYRDCPVLGGGAVATELAERGLCLPSSASLAEADQHRVVAIVRDAVAGAGSGQPIAA